MAVPIKLREEVPFAELESYGFTYWGGTNEYWYVMNQQTSDRNNVEISIRIDATTREVRLCATNDHKKLPSIYSKQYNAENYLTFEEELDAFSFEETIYPYMLVRLVNDGLIYIPKYKRKKSIDE